MPQVKDQKLKVSMSSSQVYQRSRTEVTMTVLITKRFDILNTVTQLTNPVLIIPIIQASHSSSAIIKLYYSAILCQYKLLVSLHSTSVHRGFTVSQLLTIGVIRVER